MARSRLAVLPLSVALLGPVALPASAATDLPTAFRRALAGASLSPAEVADLRALVLRSHDSGAGWAEMDAVVHAAFTPDLEYTWTAEQEAAANGVFVRVRELQAVFGIDPTPATDQATALLARALRPAAGSGVSDFVRFVTDGTLLQAAPGQAGPALPADDPSHVGTPGVPVGDVLRLVKDALPEAVRVIAYPHTGSDPYSCDGEVSARYEDNRPVHYSLEGLLKWCYNGLRVMDDPAPYRHHVIYLSRQFQPAVEYKFGGWLANDGGFAWAVGSPGQTPADEQHGEFRWRWHATFHTCFVFGKGCIFHDYPEVRLVGYFDGTSDAYASRSVLHA